jgi:subtilisin-like proprotein convertase family protein
MKKILLPAVIILLMAFGSSHAQMFWNQAANFSGNLNSYVSVTNSSGINLTTGFTLECWIKPNNVSSLQGLIWKQNPGGYAYSLVLAANGKILVGTNNAPRLTGKTVLTANQWTHVAATYSSVSNQYTIYLNGIADTSAVVPGSVPLSSPDSLFLGKFVSAFPYSGLMDEVRIWNTPVPAADIKNNFRTSLGVSPAGTEYSGLVLSIPFQNRNNSGNTFTLFDWSRNGNTAFNRGISQVSLTGHPSGTISYNEALQLDGNGDYAAIPHNADIDITGPFTFEAWVYLKDYNPGFHQTIVKKRNLAGTSGFHLVVNSSRHLTLAVNSTGTGMGTDFPLKRWVHVAITQGASGTTRFYVDGIQAFSTAAFPVPLTNTDSLFIGGHNFGEAFNGYIDEVRLSKYEKTQQNIKDYMYRQIELTNDPSPSGTDVVFNFDGNTNSSCDANMQLYLKGNARFSNPNTIEDVPVSPLVRYDNGNFPTGYRMKTVNKRIPASGTSGTLTDTIAVNSNTPITDINFFFAANHTFDGDLEISLIAPNGDSAAICFDRYTLNAVTGDIVTIFDDNADSALNNNRYTSFAPRIKPETSLNSIFGGDNPFGKWRVVINDDANGDTGYVYALGIQLNNQTLVGTGQLTGIVPEKYGLSQNYPNPFNPVTNISFELPQSGQVKMTVFDILGKEVAVLVNEVKEAGVYNVDFDGSRFSSGVYFYKLETGSFTDTKKMLLVK